MSDEAFFTTRWTRVARARGDSDEAKLALSELCEAYYPPVHRFICATVRDDERAADLTQGFFAQVLGRSAFDGADPDRGRFRAFLLGAVKHYLWDRNRFERTAKRGSGEPDIPLEDEHHAAAHLPPDEEFDRQWALTLLATALAQVKQSLESNGKANTFEALKPWLTGDSGGMRQAEAAAQLDMSESAVKVAIHRLRRQFRDAVKAEIAQTLQDSEKVTEELACLQAALRRR